MCVGVGVGCGGMCVCVCVCGCGCGVVNGVYVEVRKEEDEASSMETVSPTP